MKTLKTSGNTTSPRRHFIKIIAAGITASAFLLGGSVSVNAETKGLEKEDLKFGEVISIQTDPISPSHSGNYRE